VTANVYAAATAVAHLGVAVRDPLLDHFIFDMGLMATRSAAATAESQARLVAEDPAASNAERSDAYSVLLRVLERTGRWRDAQRELGEWVRVDVTDERINFWQMRVGSRLSSGRR
jgi:hypothetical protein